MRQQRGTSGGGGDEEAWGRLAAGETHPGPSGQAFSHHSQKSREETVKFQE